MKIGFIGCGNMATAMLKGILKSGEVKNADMIASAKKDNDEYKEALIYTGIPAIELAISEYLTKYALPAKITEGVYSFKDKIDNLGIEAKEKEKLKGNQTEVEKLDQTLNEIESSLRKGDKAEAVKEKIDGLSVLPNLKNKFEKVRSNLMSQITGKTQGLKNSRMSKDAFEANISILNSFLSNSNENKVV